MLYIEAAILEQWSHFMRKTDDIFEIRQLALTVSDALNKYLEVHNRIFSRLPVSRAW